MITHLLVSSLAAAALVGFWIATPLESTADTVADSDEALTDADEALPDADEALPQVGPAAPVEVKVALASADMRDTRVPELQATAKAPVEALAAVALVEIPDVQKMSVWEARKQLKKQGLRFAFKRGSRTVHHEDFDYYRVRKQSLQAGERVAAGTKVTLQVKEIRYASGY
jgi:hypothetical protein